VDGNQSSSRSFTTAARDAALPVSASSRSARATPVSTPAGGGLPFMPRPRRPSETSTNVSRPPPTWSGVMFP
jgi:hypothetical protein